MRLTPYSYEALATGSLIVNCLTVISLIVQITVLSAQKIIQLIIEKYRGVEKGMQYGLARRGKRVRAGMVAQQPGRQATKFSIAPHVDCQIPPCTIFQSRPKKKGKGKINYFRYFLFSQRTDPLLDVLEQTLYLVSFLTSSFYI